MEYLRGENDFRAKASYPHLPGNCLIQIKAFPVDANGRKETELAMSSSRRVHVASLYPVSGIKVKPPSRFSGPSSRTRRGTQRIDIPPRLLTDFHGPVELMAEGFHLYLAGFAGNDFAGVPPLHVLHKLRVSTLDRMTEEFEFFPFHDFLPSP
jgi:hypothetical protein